MTNSAASNLVLAPFSEPIVIQAARDCLARIGGHASCAFVFCSADYRPALPDFLELIQLHAHAPLVAGCTGSGLIGTGREAEGESGFSLLLMNLPRTALCSLALSPDATAVSVEDPEQIIQQRDIDAWITLANPLTFPIEEWLDDWNAKYPGVPCLGGLASGTEGGESFFLWRNRELIEGAVAIGFRGGIRIKTLVSQGCRPVGQPLPITGAEQNFVLSLGSRPAYQVLEETFSALSENDKMLARGNLFVGLAMSEYVDEFATGDFLVRNLLGADPQHGAVAIGARPRVGQTLQFQLRDRRSADMELRTLVTERAADGAKPFASLLFACTGRGRNLFGQSDHDAALLAEKFGTISSAGFFCNGEIGPVAGRNFVHGYTATAALFY